MVKNFQANALPVLIGSLPMGDHGDAIELVLKHTPEIPLWVQLPVYKEEGRIFQFLPGFPGLTIEGDKAFINTAGETFDDDLLKFYEEYMADLEGKTDAYNSRFALKADTAKGFFTLTEHIGALPNPPIAIKGQIAGPITFATAVKDQNRRSIFYDEQLRDAAVKLLARKASWQVRQLSRFGCPVIIFFDEPALADLVRLNLSVFPMKKLPHVLRRLLKRCMLKAVWQESMCAQIPNGLWFWIPLRILSALTLIPFLINSYFLLTILKILLNQDALLPGGLSRPHKQMILKEKQPIHWWLCGKIK